MRFSVIVKANAGKNSVKVQDDGGLLVHVTAPPVEGKANAMVIKVLAEFLHKPRSSLSIVSGHRGRYKIVEVR